MILLDKRRAVGVGADERVFGTADRTFRDPRTVTRWLVEARKRHGFEDWMTFHVWRKTTATVLDEAGATARIRRARKCGGKVWACVSLCKRHARRFLLGQEVMQAKRIRSTTL